MVSGFFRFQVARLCVFGGFFFRISPGKTQLFTVFTLPSFIYSSVGFDAEKTGLFQVTIVRIVKSAHSRRKSQRQKKKKKDDAHDCWT